RDDASSIPKYWRYLLQAWNDPKREISQRENEIQHRAGRDGWSLGLVREAIELYRPTITVERDLGTAPPMIIDADPAQYIRLDVHYPRPNAVFNFDPAYLPMAAASTRAQLL